MNGTNLIKIAVRALANNKLRGFLTMLGIIIGVASVITMLAIGQGSKRSIQAQISEMGSNMIMIHPGADVRGGVRQDASAMETLKLQDYEDIVDETRFVSAVSPSVNSSGQAIYGANNAPTTVYGISPDYLEIRRYKVEDGDMFTEQDIQTAAKVCVVGKTVVDNLFPDGGNPVGKVIRFQKLPFRIVGVLESKGYNSMGMDQDDLILAPYTTIQKKVLAITHLQGITCSALKEEYTDQAIDEISEILRRNHKLKESDDDDFTIRSQQELSTMLTSTTDMMTVLLAAVAGISLLVGGIGIMNIMYVSVTGAYTRDRPPYEYRGKRHRHPGTVPDRVHPDQCDRRFDRCSLWSGHGPCRERSRPLSDLHPALERHPVVCRLYCHRCILRMVSGQKGSTTRPDRGDTLRIAGGKHRGKKTLCVKYAS